MKEINFGFLIPGVLFAKDIKGALKQYLKFFPEHLPEKISNGIKKENFTFEQEQINRLSESSDFALDFQNRKAKFSLSIYFPFMQNGKFAGASKHTVFTFDRKVKQIGTDLYQTMIVEFSKKTETEFGYFQIPPEKSESKSSENPIYRGGFFTVASHMIQEMIPEVFMGNVYGKRYASYFGMKKLLSIPAPVVKQISEDQVYFQAVEDFDRFKPQELSENRKRIKEYLGMNNFYQEEKGPEYNYDHPDFGPKWEPTGVHTTFIT